MTAERLEQKLAELERRLKAVESRTFERQPGEGWRAIVGTIPEDEITREAARLGREWRESERPAE